ncbi:hypothetical protein MAR_017841, partial [Mya arenaria]
VYDRLQPLGISLSHSGMLETIFNTELINSIQEGKKFRIVGDNINFNIGVTNERKSTGKTGHMEHWFGSAAIVQNVSFNDCLEPLKMKLKNTVIPLQIQHKNEQKYADVVDILDTYQDLGETLYQGSGLQVPQIHIGGDQLTRERFSDAKRLRAAALTASERFENLSPTTFELFPSSNDYFSNIL